VGDTVRILVLVQAWPRYVERAQYLARSLAALRQHIVEPEDASVDYLVSSEARGCNMEAIEIQERACQGHGFGLWWRAGKPSVGGHLNDVLAEKFVHDYLFYCQEDHEAVATVDLADGVEAMDRGRAFLSRYYVAGKRLDEPTPIRGMDGWSRMGPGCYAYHFAHNPYLARPEFFTEMGPFSDENTANQRAQDLRLRFALRQPNAFRHIGEVPAMTEKHAARAAARGR
jgi:hypothetical protein